MPFSTLEKNHEMLITAYNELLAVRKNAIGLTVEQPGMSQASVESEEVFDHISKKYHEIQKSSIGKARIRDKIASLFKKDSDELVMDLIIQVEQVRLKYSRQTYKRLQYGLLAPLAFCSESSLPKVMGAPKTERVFSLTWCAQFQQLNAEETDIGLLEVTGITNGGLLQWWSDGHPDCGKQESGVWTDLKMLALKLVYLFDKVTEDDSTEDSPNAPLMSDTSSRTRIDDICTRLKKLALSLVRLLYLRHEHFNDILPLYELLVPVTYAFSILINSDNWVSMRIQAISFLENYLCAMASLRDDLVACLGAGDDMKHYEGPDNKQFSAPRLSSVDSEATLVYYGNSTKNFSLRQEAISRLEETGLTEKKVNLSGGGERVGMGSFSNVLRYPAEHGSEEYAVKFFKCKKADPERTKERLIREAKYWVGLSHKNINTLLGFCIHPQEELPGLVSKLCSYTLDDYLERNAGRVGEGEKLGYLYEVAQALQYLHQVQGLAHGDLRPPNILLATGSFAPGLVAKLNDFGVSDLNTYSDESKLTSMQHTNDVYLAPELMEVRKSLVLGFSGKKKPTEHRRVSLQGDIYAFGCVFLEVLYDKRPYYYDLHSFKKIKKNGGLPALQKDIRSQHWEFLNRVWDSKVDRRPSAKDLVDQILIFMM